MSAIVRWRLVVIRLRCSPTRRVSSTKTGSSTSANTARRQSSRNIATTVASTVVTLETIDVAVDVTTRLHAADVVGDARLHLAGARAGEEGQRHALQVAVHPGPQVVHHRLADLVREPRLVDADHAGGDGDADHAGDEPRQQGRVALRDGLVQDVAQQERRDHAEQRRDADQRRAPRRGAAGRAGTGATTRRRLARRTARSAGRSGASARMNMRLRSDTATRQRHARRRYSWHRGRGSALATRLPPWRAASRTPRNRGAEALVADTARLAARLAFAIEPAPRRGPLLAGRGAGVRGLPARRRRGGASHCTARGGWRRSSCRSSSTPRAHARAAGAAATTRTTRT